MPHWTDSYVPTDRDYHRFPASVISDSTDFYTGDLSLDSLRELAGSWAIRSSFFVCAFTAYNQRIQALRILLDSPTRESFKAVSQALSGIVAEYEGKHDNCMSPIRGALHEIWSVRETFRTLGLLNSTDSISVKLTEMLQQADPAAPAPTQAQLGSFVFNPESDHLSDSESVPGSPSGLTVAIVPGESLHSST